MLQLKFLLLFSIALLFTHPTKLNGQVTCKIQNLWVNGDFEGGDSSCLIWNPVNTTGIPGYPNFGYWTFRNVCTKAVQPSYLNEVDFDHTLGTNKGHYFYMDPRSSSGYTDQFAQNISVEPNTTYTFSLWYASMNLSSANTKATIRLAVNGVGITTDLQIPNTPDTWWQLKGTWNSGSNTTAKASFQVLDPQVGGYDCAADDVVFSSGKLIADAGPDSMICVNSPIKIGGNPTAKYGAVCSNLYSYVWTPTTGIVGSSTISNPTIKLSASGSTFYYVQVKDKNGNTCNDTVKLTVKSTGATPKLGNDTNYCKPFNRLLNPGTFASYKWNDLSTKSTLTASKPGLYWVEVNNGCSIFRDSIVFSLDTVPKILLGNDTLYCKPFKRNFSVNKPAKAKYKWSSNWNLIDTISWKSMANKAGIYWLEVSNSCNTVRDSVIIQRDTTPIFNLGADTVYCASFSRTLKCQISYPKYKWNNGSTNTSLVVSSAGTYWLSVSNSCGTKSDTIVINKDTIPSVNLGNDTTYCSNFSRLLFASGNVYNYLWSDGSAGNFISANTAGTYWLRATNICGSVTDTIHLFRNYLNIPRIGNDTFYCDNFIRTFKTDKPFSQYLWSDGTTSNSITVNKAGTYWVQSTGPCGVSGDTIVLTQNSKPVFSLGNDTSVCLITGIILTNPLPQFSPLWKGGINSQSILVKNAGNYKLTLCNAGCCASDSITISGSSGNNDIMYFPTAFTPNGDGLNDHWPLKLLDRNVESLKIINRWGEIIYDSNNSNQGWDGKFNSNAEHISENIFIYICVYRNCANKRIYAKGNFTLIR